MALTADENDSAEILTQGLGVRVAPSRCEVRAIG